MADGCVGTKVRSWRRASTCAAALGLFAGVSIVGVACGGPPPAGTPVDCPSGKILTLDCSSEIAYQGVKTGGGVDILGIGSANASFEEQVLRQVNDELERFVSVQTRLCREYNACVLDRDKYNEAAAATREKFETASAIAARAKGGDKKAIEELWASVVPDSVSPEQLTLEVRVDAKLPASGGGGDRIVRSGGALPTNARIAFSFKPSKKAYVYLYQTTPSGEVTVLFPNAKIQGVDNPVAGGASTRIPAGNQWIRVNEKDLGEEKVFVLASVKPVPALEKSLAAAAAGAVKMADDPVLAKVGGPSGDASCRGLEIEACPGERGLELPGGDSSMIARTSPNDGAIVRVFTFKHLSEEEFAKLPPESATGERGVVIHD